MMPINNKSIQVHPMRKYAARGFTKSVLSAGHRKQYKAAGCLATLTTVPLPAQYGLFEVSQDQEEFEALYKGGSALWISSRVHEAVSAAKGGG